MPYCRLWVMLVSLAAEAFKTVKYFPHSQLSPNEELPRIRSRVYVPYFLDVLSSLD